MTARMISVIPSIAMTLCLRWLEELSTHRGEGWQLIQKSLAKGEEAVGQALLQACKSMAWLEGHPGRGIRLAVLSAYATSDPHALDVNRLGGKLFLHLLSMGAGVRLPTEAEARAALYYNWGAGRIMSVVASSISGWKDRPCS